MVLESIGKPLNEIELSKIVEFRPIKGFSPKMMYSLCEIINLDYNYHFDSSLDEIRKAIEAGFCPVKLNMVLLKGVNVGDVPEMIEYAQQTGTILQLIELDPINVSNKYYSTHHRSLDEQEDMLREKAVTVEKRQFMHNRLIYHLPNATVEVVHPIENSDFCMHCTRMRVTSDGKLKPCLMRNDNLTDILTPIRQGANDEQLKRFFVEANSLREPYNRS